VPHRCHQAIGVLGAVSVATACLLDGSPAASVTRRDPGPDFRIEHPSGVFDVRVQLEPGSEPVVTSAGVIRTARKLMDGLVFAR
jgi:4-oxalomesaconate tautomerase